MTDDAEGCEACLQLSASPEEQHARSAVVRRYTRWAGIGGAPELDRGLAVCGRSAASGGQRNPAKN